MCLCVLKELEKQDGDVCAQHLTYFPSDPLGEHLSSNTQISLFLNNMYS